MASNTPTQVILEDAWRLCAGKAKATGAGRIKARFGCQPGLYIIVKTDRCTSAGLESFVEYVLHSNGKIRKYK